jgi:hypothetical protein
MTQSELHHHSTHCGLQSLDANLILQRDRDAMKRSYNLASFFEAFIQLASAFESAIDENFG